MSLVSIEAANIEPGGIEKPLLTCERHAVDFPCVALTFRPNIQVAAFDQLVAAIRSKDLRDIQS